MIKLYKGESAKACDIYLQIRGEYCVCRSGLEEYQYKISDCLIEAPLAGCPLIIQTVEKHRIEIPPNEIKDEHLDLLQNKSKLLTWLEKNTFTVCFSVIFTFGFIYVNLEYGLPYYSRHIAHILPQNFLNQIDRTILSSLDGPVFEETELGDAKQKEIREYLEPYAPFEVKILFRKYTGAGPNAFALAGKTIIFTDKFIEYMTSIFFYII